MAFDRLDPGNAALVVIDVQNDFCSPSGVMALSGKDVSGVLEMMPKLVELIERAHSAGVPVVLVQTLHSDETTTEPWRFRTGQRESVPNCVPGSWGAELYEITPHPADHIVTKHRYSAFSSPEFVGLMTQLAKPSLLFCGVATNVCVETSIRDATCADYYATLVEDCSSAYLSELHRGSVENINSHFGVVVTTSDVIDAWNKAG